MALDIKGLGEVPKDIITLSTSIINSEFSISIGLLLPEESSSPSFILMHFIPFTQPFSSVKISVGLVKTSKITPSSLAWWISSNLAGSSFSLLL